MSVCADPPWLFKGFRLWMCVGTYFSEYIRVRLCVGLRALHCCTAACTLYHTQSAKSLYRILTVEFKINDLEEQDNRKAINHPTTLL